MTDPSHPSPGPFILAFFRIFRIWNLVMMAAGSVIIGSAIWRAAQAHQYARIPVMVVVWIAFMVLAGSFVLLASHLIRKHREQIATMT